jgi:hypothetical protein
VPGEVKACLVGLAASTPHGSQGVQLTPRTEHEQHQVCAHIGPAARTYSTAHRAPAVMQANGAQPTRLAPRAGSAGRSSPSAGATSGVCCCPQPLRWITCPHPRVLLVQQRQAPPQRRQRQPQPPAKQRGAWGGCSPSPRRPDSPASLLGAPPHALQTRLPSGSWRRWRAHPQCS